MDGPPVWDSDNSDGRAAMWRCREAQGFGGDSLLPAGGAERRWGMSLRQTICMAVAQGGHVAPAPRHGKTFPVRPLLPSKCHPRPIHPGPRAEPEPPVFTPPARSRALKGKKRKISRVKQANSPSRECLATPLGPAPSRGGRLCCGYGSRTRDCTATRDIEIRMRLEGARSDTPDRSIMIDEKEPTGRKI